MEGYTETLESVGDSILQWVDPEYKFQGYTEVSLARWNDNDDDDAVAYLLSMTISLSSFVLLPWYLFPSTTLRTTMTTSTTTTTKTTTGMGVH